MKSLLNVATASVNTVPLALSHNATLIKELIVKANSEKVDLLLLPELALSGYGCEDMFFSQGFLLENQKYIKEIAKSIDKGLIVAFGFPLLIPGEQVFNACAVLNDEGLIGIACKQHLARQGIHYEPRWFNAWPEGERIQLNIADKLVPVGDIVLDIDDIKIGFEICEDAWVASRPGRSCFQKGVDIILNPSASHFALGKEEDRYQFCKEGSRAFGCVYMYSNFVGCEAGRAIYDGGNIIASEGKIVSLGERFSFLETTFETAVVDVEANRARRLSASESFISKDTTEYDKVDWAFIEKNHKGINKEVSPVTMPTEQNICFAIALGLWDWQRKTKQSGYVVSLSGGADSGLCAVAVFLAHYLALDTLGLEQYINALQAMSIRVEANHHQDAEAWLKEIVMPKVLTTVYQSTKNSGELTMAAAKQLASDIGSRHLQWSVDEMVDAYIERVDAHLEKQLNWQDDDIALQNIQARARAPGVWLLANKENKLLLSTSNLSEASVGYCTMDGDTSGVLAPIGGLSKTHVLAVNRFLLDKGISLNRTSTVIKITGLKQIVSQKPTAELRPTEQSDEHDLMPFEVLDTIRRLSQVAYFDPKAILSRLLNERFKENYDKDQLTKWCSRYFSLYTRNQWKRERLAVSLHLEQDSACPKTYRRFPVLNQLDY